MTLCRWFGLCNLIIPRFSHRVCQGWGRPRWLWHSLIISDHRRSNTRSGSCQMPHQSSQSSIRDGTIWSSHHVTTSSARPGVVRRVPSSGEESYHQAVEHHVEEQARSDQWWGLQSSHRLSDIGARLAPSSCQVVTRTMQRATTKQQSVVDGSHQLV